MTIYFEGNGNPKPVTDQQARDQLIVALQVKRDEIMAEVEYKEYDDQGQAYRDVINRTIHGVLSVLNGETDNFPSVNMIPASTDEEIQTAKDAGADYFDNSSGDIGAGIADYWNLVNN